MRGQTRAATNIVSGEKAISGRNGPTRELRLSPPSVESSQLIGDKEATAILFDTIAERFAERPGGYTRIVRLAMPRLGDAGTQAILELVGKNDRVSKKAERPSFADDDDSAAPAEEPVADDTVEEVEASAGDESSADDSTGEEEKKSE